MTKKILRENEKEFFFEVCLVKWEGKKINSKTQAFFS